MFKTQINKLKNLIGINLIKLLFKIELYLAKITLKIRSKSTLLINYELRLSQEDLLQIGEDDHVDDVIYYVICKTLELKDEQSMYAQKIDPSDKNLINKLESEIKSNERVKNAIADYYMANAYIRKYLKDTNGENLAISKANLYKPNQSPWDPKKVSYKKKEIAKNINAIGLSLEERSFKKFEMTIGDVTSVITLITTILIAAGYLYSTQLFKLLGIDISNYFTITDYLSYSVMQVRNVLLPTLFNSLFLVFGLRNGSLKSVSQIENEKPYQNRMDKFLLLLLLGVSGMTIWSIYIEKINYQSMSISSMIFSLIISSWLAKKFFKNYIPTFIFLAFTTQLLSQTTIKAMENSEQIKNGEFKINIKNPEIQIEGLSKIEAKNSVIFATTSNYIFVIDKTNKNLSIYPIKLLKKISISQ